MLDGFATPAGTNRYADRFPSLRQSGHFRQQKHVPGVSEFSLSSIGLGTYLGEPSDEADVEYIDAIVAAVRSGVNVLDTAINYRHQRSERNIGEVLQRLTASGDLSRDEVLVCTKAGYLSFDGNVPADPRAYFQKEYVAPGTLDPAQIAGGMHCMAPKYLANQIERSRQNLGLATIDVFYVHNPESQLGEVSRDVFDQRLHAAFTMLEEVVAQGKIRFYGVATWSAFRLPQGSRDYLGLKKLASIAEDIAGTDHHFRFVQLPFNLAMSEAFGLANQTLDGKTVPLLAAANALGIAVIASGTLYQGQLARGLPDFLGKALGTRSDAETAIQFSRSAPGITTSLVGMGQKEHVAQNVKLAAQRPATREMWMSLFSDREKSG
jgi:aryl-alcohol dehydrogenase-like predicted oxidoreductase